MNEEEGARSLPYLEYRDYREYRVYRGPPLFSLKNIKIKISIEIKIKIRIKIESINSIEGIE